MSEMLREYVDSRGVAVRVDRDASVIRGVKILGLRSRNGRTYLPAALSGAVCLYEEAKVNVNHAKSSPLGPRDYQDRIGVIRNVVVRADDGLFADFHFNPKHALAEQLIWDAEHSPENVGFSHNVEALTARRGDRLVVEAIRKVQSVDLVADPATTLGLFESTSDVPAKTTELALKLADATVADLKRCRADLVETVIAEQATEVKRLREEIDQLHEADEIQRKRRLVRQLLLESDLPDPETADASAQAIVGRRFIESLLAAPDERTMRELVKERAELVRSVGRRDLRWSRPDGQPLCRDQNELILAAPVDAEAFVKAIS